MVHKWRHVLKGRVYVCKGLGKILSSVMNGMRDGGGRDGLTIRQTSQSALAYEKRGPTKVKNYIKRGWNEVNKRKRGLQNIKWRHFTLKLFPKKIISPLNCFPKKYQKMPRAYENLNPALRGSVWQFQMWQIC